MRQTTLTVVLSDSTTLSTMRTVEEEMRSYGSFERIKDDPVTLVSAVTDENDWMLRGAVEEMARSIEAIAPDATVSYIAPGDVP